MIKIENHKVFSTTGLKIRHKTRGTVGSIMTTLATDTADDFDELTAADVEAIKESEHQHQLRKAYESRVAQLIRERYSADEENAIKTKLLDAMLNPQPATTDTESTAVTYPYNTTISVADEFNTFNAWRNTCKQRARLEVYNQGI